MIEILHGGTQTTVQDQGRFGHRHLGIPSSGAADRLSFALANWMAGNRWNAPALECALGGLHIRFTSDTTIGIAGAEMWAQINGQNVNNFTAIPVQKGDILTLSFARDGCRAYIAVAGGIKLPKFMDSTSTYLPAQIGGLEGRALRTGDKLVLSNRPREAPRTIPKGFTPSLSRHIVLRARAAPEWENLDKPSQRHLFVSPFHASAATDRMGARLRGDRISMNTPISHDQFSAPTGDVTSTCRWPTYSCPRRRALHRGLPPRSSSHPGGLVAVRSNRSRVTGQLSPLFCRRRCKNLDREK